MTALRLLVGSALLMALPVHGPAADAQTAAPCFGDTVTVDGREVCEPIPRADTFARLLSDYEAWRLHADPIRAGQEGDRAAARIWPDVSPEADARRAAQLRAFQRRLGALAVPPGESLNAEALAYVLDRDLRRAPFDEARLPFLNDSGFFTQPGSVARQTVFRTAEDYSAYAERLTKLPGWFKAHRANMDRGIATGVTASDQILPGVIEIIRRMAETPVEEHPTFAPFLDFPDSVSARDRRRLTDLGRAAVSSSVIPAYRDLLDHMETTYAPAARTTAGIGDSPAAREHYKALVRHYTTLDMTPDEVHRVGQSEVRRIRREMEREMRASGFEGSFAEFIEFLRTDPRFYAKSEDELLMRASWLAKRVDGVMPEYFGKLPRLPYGVMKVPDEIAPSYTTGRYWGGSLERGQAGNYMVNTHDLSARPLYNLPALTLHEGVPGHHHQISLAQELEGVPAFRQDLYPNAFGEGWGLYAERLGEEMGLYDTPYERFGRLTYEMWRACRLVVDTGMHWKGWSRERAEACFLENSALSRSNIRTEVDRYISWPGQALAYKVGELKIVELRERAEAELGERFDIRAFHDAVLEDGGLPLAMLERKIDRWIAERRG